MQGLNVIAVFDETAEKMLMCKRRKDPYKGLFNFVGGKIMPDEDGLAAAYRELEEETAITKSDIFLTHLLDFTYHLDDCYVEVYVGKLNKHVDVRGDENELFWSSLDHDFFDPSQYAGEGNIGHIMMHIEMAWDRLLKTLDISLASGADFEEVLSLYRAAIGEEGCTWDEDYPGEKDIRGDLGRDALFCARNETGEIIAAFSIDDDAQVERLSCWSPEIVPAGEIARLVVRRDYQNRGIAGRLLEYAMEELGRRGYGGIHFLVSQSNVRALRAYAKLSFEQVGETELYGHDWYCFEKKLDGSET